MPAGRMSERGAEVVEGADPSEPVVLQVIEGDHSWEVSSSWLSPGWFESVEIVAEGLLRSSSGTVVGPDPVGCDAQASNEEEGEHCAEKGVTGKPKY